MTETEKQLRCVVCPIGCAISAVLDEDGNVLSVTGNTCPRGKAYAEAHGLSGEKYENTAKMY